MDNEAIRLQLEELTEAVRALSEKQNAQYTDLMLKFDELKHDKERLDLVLMDAAQLAENQFEEAKAAVIKAGKASTSYIQRKLGVGYERAVMLMDRLEEEMIVGEADGAKPREVLVKDKGELEQGAFASEMADEDAEDNLYPEAKKLALEMSRISTSYIQRKLGTGYARAARLLGILEEKGVIEHGDGAKPRKVLKQT